MLRSILALALFSSVFSYGSDAWSQNRKRPTGTAREEAVNYLYAGAFRHEVGSSTTYSEIASADGDTVISLEGTYKYMIAKSMQLGTILQASMISGNGNNNTYTGLWATFTYNLNNSWNINDSYFIEAGAGLIDSAIAVRGLGGTGKAEKKFAWMAMFGKHIPLYERIRYTPKAGFKKVGDLDMAITLIPLNFTFAF